MCEYDRLKERVDAVIEELDSLMTYFDTLSRASRKGKSAQLQEIEKTIQNMQKQGLAIPPELRKLKLDFLSELDDVEKHIALKQNLTGNIERIFSVKTQRVEKKKSAPVKKPKSKKANPFPPDGTSCRFVYKGQTYRAQIQNNQMAVDNYGVFSSFSAASVKISQTSRNGWKDWELWNPESKRWIVADIWRKMNK